MDEKESVKDYLRRRLQIELNNVRLSITSCTISTIRWLQRYSHCYSIACSFFCFPLWILIFPIALVFDMCIFTMAAIIFLIAFILHFLFAPYALMCQFSSCLDAWNPANIYRYSLREALRWLQTILLVFGMMWMCYCGTGEVENGAPTCCAYCCCFPGCRQSCSDATHVEMQEQPCTIL